MADFLGVDTGGTFTDFIYYSESTGSVHIHKVLSTPAAPEKAILQGISELDVETRDLILVHGSTVATNAVLEGKGVTTAYVTNRGLADVLTIGRQARQELYNLVPEKQLPLIAPELCFEVDSRLAADGAHLEKLDDQELSRLVTQLQQSSAKAVSINLLFSFLDDSEERKIEQAINSAMPGIFISRSSDVLPEYKEYERGMTTTLNAMVGPLMQGYLTRLAENVQGADLSIMQSSGGTTSAEQAGCYPVNLLLSGPAGGLKGAQYVAAMSSRDKLLSFDMGGTSTDVSIMDQGIGFTTESSIAGYPVAVPMVDMHTIGAGGGSIARVDAGGMLLVGPESAGASPGPACYGNGGELPTVTDANVILGRLLPEAFLGGNMSLDKAAAEKAFRRIADPLAISLEQSAKGIIDVVNDHMVRALRVMSVERGEDPKEFSLVSFGGAGGLHVCALADELEMTDAVVPVNAGVLSALGMLVAEASRERSRTVNRGISECQIEEINHQFDELLQQAKRELQSNGSQLVQDLAKDLGVDVRYRGQSYALPMHWNTPMEKNDLKQLEESFHQLHQQHYGHQMNIPVELVNLRVRVSVQNNNVELPAWKPTESLSVTEVEMPGFSEPVSVYNRYGLEPGQKLQGPCLVTETSSTTWIDRHWQLEVDAVGNLLLSKTG